MRSNVAWFEHQSSSVYLKYILLLWICCKFTCLAHFIPDVLLIRKVSIATTNECIWFLQSLHFFSISTIYTVHKDAESL